MNDFLLLMLLLVLLGLLGTLVSILIESSLPIAKNTPVTRSRGPQ